jgi:uncharacterized protein YegP (UPF0339 family)
MSPRLHRLEVVRSDSGFFWRFLSSNGRELARSSQTYSRRCDAARCADLVTGATYLHADCDERTGR